MSRGVPGGQGLDLAVGQGGVADVLDLADVQPAPHDLGDEPGFAFDCHMYQSKEHSVT